MKMVTINRRRFLIGAGGSLLALPFLPSLSARTFMGATAEAAAIKPPRRVVFVASAYGIPGPSIFGPGNPSVSVGPSVRAMPLADFSGEIGVGVLKNYFNSVKSKVNLIRGLDQVGHSNHNRTSFLCAQVTGDMAPPTFPSVDILMENSPNVYPAGSTALKALRMNGFFPVGDEAGFGDPFSTWSWQRKSDGSMGLVPYLTSDQAAFQTVFGSSSGTANQTQVLAQENSLIMDSVLSSFNRLLGNKRLSALDKSRLQAHAQRVHETQTGTSANSCAPWTLAKYTNDQTVSHLYSNYFKTAISAMTCAGTRIVVIYITHPMDKYYIDHDASISYHHNFSHQMNPKDPTNMPDYVSYSSFISSQVANLAQMMDGTVEADGSNLLDNSLIVWGNELGEVPGAHRTITQGLVTIGGLQGTVRTGNYLDFRRLDTPVFETYAGYPYHSFLVGLMDRMGLQQSEYLTQGDAGGFGGWTANGSGEGFSVLDLAAKYASGRNSALPYFYL